MRRRIVVRHATGPSVVVKRHAREPRTSGRANQHQATGARTTDELQRRITRVAILLISGLAAQCSAREGIDIIHVDRPYWYEASLFVTFVYLLIGPLLAFRGADARVVAALPAIGNTAVASFAVFNLLGILTEVGYVAGTGGNAIAAGLAEAIFPWCMGAAVSAVIGLVIGLNSRFAGARARRTSLGSIALMIAVGATVMAAGLIWYLRPSAANYGQTLGAVATIPFAIAVVSLGAALASLAWPNRSHSKTENPQRWFIAFAAAAATTACVLWVVSEMLTAIAAGRT
jgi:hypothetical protein